MRKLATIRRISEINPIKGKDRVEMATVDGWTCMVSKADGFKPGSLCIFCEPDSVFPAIEQWEFLKKYGYRIKTQRFKSDDGYVYSQGLVLPISALPSKRPAVIEVGDDMTSLLGITQYEPTMDKGEASLPKKKYPKWLMRFSWFRKLVLPKKGDTTFPSFISKTDEERIQNMPQILERPLSWIVTEKIDGQSGTFVVVRHRFLFWSRYEFIVCSRNYRIPKPDGRSYWKVAEKYHIKEALKGYLKKHPGLKWAAIQGECIDTNVQGNKYKVKEADLYVFNVMDSITRRYNTPTASVIAKSWGLKFVPIVDTRVKLEGYTVEQVLEYANGKSMLNKDTLREGLVFRVVENGFISFKAVSPEFLFKYGE